MSDLKAHISEYLITAMKAREMDKVKVVRGVQAAIKKIEIDERIELDDKQVLAVLEKQIKQRKESIAIFSKNDRADLADKEQFELELIQGFMPQQMSAEELTALVTQEVTTQGATSMKDMGKVMGALREKTAGRADPAMISQLIKQALSAK